MSSHNQSHSEHGPGSSSASMAHGRRQGAVATVKPRAARPAVSAVFLLEASAHLERLFPDTDPSEGSSPSGAASPHASEPAASLEAEAPGRSERTMNKPTPSGALEDNPSSG